MNRNRGCWYKSKSSNREDVIFVMGDVGTFVTLLDRNLMGDVGTFVTLLDSVFQIFIVVIPECNGGRCFIFP